MPGFSTTRTLAFGDCDPSGIAYFPSYLDLMVGVLEAFFAEIGTIPGGNPIVIDDPVSSLDHRRRERVARRIAKEGAKRCLCCRDSATKAS